MATRGVGGDRKPETHELTEEKQGRFHYTMGPYSDPVLHIKPGDRVVVQTRDAFEGKITKPTSPRNSSRCRFSIRRTAPS
jgi:amidase